MTTALENLKKIKQEAMQKVLEEGLIFSTRIYIGVSTCEIAAGSKEVGDFLEIWQFILG